MASQQTYLQAVAAAVDSASVDRDRDESEWVLFEPQALSRLTQLFTEVGGSGKTKQAWREAWDDALADPIDASRALALMRLKERLTGVVDRVYEETSDGLQERIVAPLTADQAQTEDLSWYWPPGV